MNPMLVALPDDVTKAIGSFSRGAAGGPGGGRPQIWADCVNCRSEIIAADVVASIAAVVNVLFRGDVPADVAPFLASADLFALEKPDGGVRPIACGLTIRRLAGKIAIAKTKDRAADFLTTSGQFGVGVPSATQLLNVSVSCCIERMSKDPSPVPPSLQDNPHMWDFEFLKIDFRNAYNLVSRKTFLSEIKLEFPELYPFVSSLYARDPRLFWGTHRLSSRSGSQQGDPLGGFLFTLVLRKLLTKIVSECPEIELSSWYIDDGGIVARRQTLVEIWKIILRDVFGQVLVCAHHFNQQSLKLTRLANRPGNRQRFGKSTLIIIPTISY